MHEFKADSKGFQICVAMQKVEEEVDDIFLGKACQVMRPCYGCRLFASHLA